LAFADCDTCNATAEFDANGRVEITHEPGCRDHAEFMRRVDEIESGGDTESEEQDKQQ
jgi:hypothetical protein